MPESRRTKGDTAHVSRGHVIADALGCQPIHVRQTGVCAEEWKGQKRPYWIRSGMPESAYSAGPMRGKYSRQKGDGIRAVLRINKGTVISPFRYQIVKRQISENNIKMPIAGCP